MSLEKLNAARARARNEMGNIIVVQCVDGRSRSVQAIDLIAQVLGRQGAVILMNNMVATYDNEMLAAHTEQYWNPSRQLSSRAPSIIVIICLAIIGAVNVLNAIARSLL